MKKVIEFNIKVNSFIIKLLEIILLLPIFIIIVSLVLPYIKLYAKLYF